MSERKTISTDAERVNNYDSQRYAEKGITPKYYKKDVARAIIGNIDLRHDS